MQMQLTYESVQELIKTAVNEIVKAINKQQTLNPQPNIKYKSAYAKTEALLFSYNNFKRIVEERKQEIEDLRKYGVPQKCGAVGERVQNGNLPQGIVLPEESVESAVCRIERSVQDTVQAINLIDKCMAALKHDPYYEILPMRYFEGRTQEDVAVYFKCDQGTISRNKGRLIRELAMRLFPDQSVNEMMQ